MRFGSSAVRLAYLYILMIKIHGWNGMSAQVLWHFAATLTYLNSSLNLILYYWKIRELRQAVKDIESFVVKGALPHYFYHFLKKGLRWLPAIIL